jgi:hypothetical protein
MGISIPLGKPRLINDVSSRVTPEPVVTDVPAPKIEQLEEPLDAQAKISKLKDLLSEKNRELERLNKELQALQAGMQGFDKVKALLEDEILRLREQNRVLKSEIIYPNQANQG